MWELRNVVLPDGKLVCIQIDGGKIAVITEEPKLNEFIECGGMRVLPGLIDLHVHTRDFEERCKETWETAEAAAVSGGVTTIAAMPNTKPPLTSVDRAEVVNDYIGNPNYGYPAITCRHWFGATPSNIKEIEQSAHFSDFICGVKVYRGSSTGDLLVEDDVAFERICRVCAETGQLVAVHAENEAMLKRNRSHYQNPTIADHCQIRDTEIEVTAVERVLQIQQATRCGIYFCHISTPEAVDLIMAAKAKGAHVYIEVCPHHLLFTHEKLGGECGARFKMNPPLRSSEQVTRLRRLLFEGNIDVVGSDHAPHNLEEKARTNYDEIPSGVPGVENLFSIMFDFVRQGKLTLDQFIALTSRRQAEILGIPTKGRIEPGCDADLVVVDEKRLAKMEGGTTKSKCGWTPYDGLIAPAPPRLVIAGGRVAINKLTNSTNA